ncbi:hypothetical protein CJ179_49605 [Rhodococcus sp. ACS1]|nr:hypothetical protein CJ179_49605 [Rhodococcus sp. ACS1]
MRCDLCEHRFTAAVAGKSDACSFAQTNGWIIDGTTRCPMCAATQSATDQDEPAAGPQAELW